MLTKRYGFGWSDKEKPSAYITGTCWEGGWCCMGWAFPESCRHRLMAEMYEVEHSKHRTALHLLHRGNVPVESVIEYWKRALYSIDHLVVELEDRLLSAHGHFQVQYVFYSIFDLIRLYMAVSFDNLSNWLFLGVIVPVISNWQLPLMGFESKPQRRGTTCSTCSSKVRLLLHNTFGKNKDHWKF